MAPSNDWTLNPDIDNLVRDKARKLSLSAGFNRSDQPDIEQRLRLHLWRKSLKYDPARSKQTTWAKRLIENKARSIVRKTEAKKCTYRRNVVSLNEVVVDHEGGVTQLANLLDVSAGRRHTGQQIRSAIEVADLKMDLADANRDLPWPLKKLAAVLSHVTEFPAGQVLGMSRRKTARHLEAIRQRYLALV
jgi:hypothetical protein